MCNPVPNNDTVIPINSIWQWHTVREILHVLTLWGKPSWHENQYPDLFVLKTMNLIFSPLILGNYPICILKELKVIHFSPVRMPGCRWFRGIYTLRWDWGWDIFNFFSRLVFDASQKQLSFMTTTSYSGHCCLWKSWKYGSGFNFMS